MTVQPQAWVISLAERPDRLAAFRRRAAGAELDVHELVVEKCTVKRDGWGGSPEACGCAQAHQALLSMGDGPLLIFEDDAMLPPSLTGYLDVAQAAMPAGWELCLFGSTNILTDAHTPALVPVPLLRFLCTHAYWVSAAGRPHLAAAAREANHHWDHLASKRMCGRGQTYGFVPSVVDQDRALGSDIG